MRVKGAGLVSLGVEGVEWLDPGRVGLSGEPVVEVPVKPGESGLRDQEGASLTQLTQVTFVILSTG